eukprot:828296-Pleurochrysis_carterae.AAC.1
MKLAHTRRQRASPTDRPHARAHARTRTRTRTRAPTRTRIRSLARAHTHSQVKECERRGTRAKKRKREASFSRRRLPSLNQTRPRKLELRSPPRRVQSVLRTQITGHHKRDVMAAWAESDAEKVGQHLTKTIVVFNNFYSKTRPTMQEKCPSSSRKLRGQSPGKWQGVKRQ